MKKTFIFALMAAALGFTACSSDDDSIAEKTTQKGMVLRATVEQPAESRATFTDNEGTWQFDFTTGDNITVTNSKISTDYTFTNDGKEFKSKDAEPTNEPARWYAFYPSKEMSFVGQTGKWEDLAKVYALVGSTPYGTGDVTGENGLDITMEPKVAILKIINKKGSIDINVKNSASTWVKGLIASGSSFNLTMMGTKQTLLSTMEKGTYYIAVPARQQLAIKNGDDVVKSTYTSGLTAGKYYELAIMGPTTGTAKATINNSEVDVNWVQLWDDGPKFAEYNVGATSVTDYGDYYSWGGFENVVGTQYPSYNEGLSTLFGETDTATKLWGSKWRMPTKEEFDNLLAECDVKWIDGSTDKYNNTTVTGLLCTGKDAYSSNSVFLPAAGYWKRDKVSGKGYGYYWSSTPDGSDYARSLGFQSRSQYVYCYDRDYGYSVRAVLAED